MSVLRFLLQSSREERTSSGGGSPGSHGTTQQQSNLSPSGGHSPQSDAPLGRALMEAALQQASNGSEEPPLVVTPSGYWVDGTDHRHPLDSAGRALLPAQPAWQPRIDQDDTAKCYRRFFVGRVNFDTLNFCLSRVSPFTKNRKREKRKEVADGFENSSTTFLGGKEEQIIEKFSEM